MRRRLSTALASLAACAALAIGCAKESDTGVVTGTVTLDGAPLKTGQIRFVPVDGQSPTAGAVITDGKYTATVSLGEKSVEISSPQEGPARRMYDPAPQSAQANSGGDLVPARYNAHSELKIDVRPDAEPYNFELLGK